MCLSDAVRLQCYLFLENFELTLLRTHRTLLQGRRQAVEDLRNLLHEHHRNSSRQISCDSTNVQEKEWFIALAQADILMHAMSRHS